VSSGERWKQCDPENSHSQQHITGQILEVNAECMVPFNSAAVEYPSTLTIVRNAKLYFGEAGSLGKDRMAIEAIAA
jgi:hypothetical protein